MASLTSDVVMSPKRELSRSGNVSMFGCCGKSACPLPEDVSVKSLIEISPPIVYVVTVILSSFKGQLTCGSWLSVAVISEETEEFFRVGGVHI